MKKISLISLTILSLTYCAKVESPYVKGVVVKKQYIKGHFESQRPIITNEASIFGVISCRPSISSPRSCYGIRSSGFKSMSSSRPSYVKSFNFRSISFKTSRPNSRESLVYKSESGKYYTPIMDYDSYHSYEHCYNYSRGNMILIYILLFHNMKNNEEEPTKYFLPEYRLNVSDSTKNAEWVDVDSIMYFKTKIGDTVNFKRFKVAEYEDESF